MYIKVARYLGVDIENEINTIDTIKCELAPTIINYDDENKYFCVTLAKKSERLSNIVGDNFDRAYLDYLYEYGRTFVKLYT